MELQERIIELLTKHKKGLGHKEIGRKLSLGKRHKAEVHPLLKQLADEQVLVCRNNKYRLADASKLIAAEIVKVTQSFGFAKPEAGERDYFVPGRLLRGAMPGDKVLLALKQSRGELPEAEVSKIVEERNPQFSGTVVVDEDGALAVLPDRYLKQPLRIAAGLENGAKAGERVVAVMEARGIRHFEHAVRIIELLSDAPSAASCAKAILRENGIQLEFSPEDGFADDKLKK